MRTAPLATTFFLIALLPVAAEPQASRSEDISQALGGDHWKPKAQRALPPTSAAEAAKSAPKGEPPLDIEALGVGGGLVLPAFDMDAECGPTGKNNLSRNICLEQEQAAYDSLTLVWDQLPIDVKDTCRDFPTYKSVRYRRIALCVSSEMDKLRLNKDQSEHRRFRY